MLYTAKVCGICLTKVGRSTDSFVQSVQPDRLTIKLGASTNLRGDMDRQERNAEVVPAAMSQLTRLRHPGSTLTATLRSGRAPRALAPFRGVVHAG